MWAHQHLNVLKVYTSSNSLMSKVQRVLVHRKFVVTYSKSIRDVEKFADLLVKKTKISAFLIFFKKGQNFDKFAKKINTHC